MDGNSKLCAGPVWDFDWQTFPNKALIDALNANPGLEGEKYSPKGITADWLYKDSKFDAFIHNISPQAKDQAFMWYPALFKDAAFRVAVQNRWKAIYPQLVAVGAELMPLVESNRKSWEVNREMWPSLIYRPSSMSSCFNGDEAMTDYKDVIENIVAMYNIRLEWMNAQINAGNFVTNAK